MKKSRQVISRQQTTTPRTTKRRFLNSRHPRRQSQPSDDIIVFLLPGEMTAQEDLRLRVAVNKIRAPKGESFTPQRWTTEKAGASVAIPRNEVDHVITELSQFNGLAVAIASDECVMVFNFGDKNMPSGRATYLIN